MNIAIVDICFSEIFGEILNRTHKSSKIIILPLIFNIGDVNDIENLLINDYLNYSKEKKQILANQLKYCKKELNNSNNFFRIWYSETSSEYCGMLYIIHLLNEIYGSNCCNISLINCTQNYYLENENATISYKSTREIPDERITFFLRKEYKLTTKLKQKFLIQYNEYFKVKYRVIENGKLRSISEKECEDIFLSLIKKPKVNIFYIISYITLESLLDDENIARYIMIKLSNNKKIRISGDYIFT